MSTGTVKHFDISTQDMSTTVTMNKVLYPNRPKFGSRSKQKKIWRTADGTAERPDLIKSMHRTPGCKIEPAPKCSTNLQAAQEGHVELTNTQVQEPNLFYKFKIEIKRQKKVPVP
jgi:hypothetical protein